MIKRQQLEKHLKRCGCILLREGGKHSVWENPANDRRATMPRHREIPRTTARAICSQLGITLI